MKTYLVVLYASILLCSAGSITSKASKYLVWKENKEEEWQKEKRTTLAEQVKYLLLSIYNALDSLKADPANSSFQETALHAYNFLRELLNLPMARSFSDINRAWVDQVVEEAEVYAFMERQKYDIAAPELIQLVNKLTNVLNVSDKIKVFATERSPQGGLLSTIKDYLEDHGQDETYGIALCRTPDLEAQLAAIYHEIGHIVHRDQETMLAIKRGEKTYEKLLQDPSFSKDVDEIDRYLEIGKHAFDRSTPIGKRITDILSEYTYYWNPPTQTKYHEMLYARGQEKRADLFALKKLLEHKHLNTILQDIAHFIFKPAKIIADPLDVHPSDFERALYVAGFLVDKGIDINKAFKHWYATGQCKPVPPQTLSTLLSTPPKSKGARDFLAAYTKWMKKREQENYSTWKLEKLQTWQGRYDTLASQAVSLAWDLNNALDQLKEEPHSVQRQQRVLYTYNFLRERLNQKPITSIKDINVRWVDQQHYKFWKEEKQERWLQENRTTLAKKALRLLLEIEYEQDMLQTNPQSTTDQKELLFMYNFLRELLKTQPAATLRNIDQEWLDVQNKKFVNV